MVKPTTKGLSPNKNGVATKPVHQQRGFEAHPLTVARDKRIAGQLVGVFMQERPHADYVEVVPGSVKAVDPKFNLFKALVRTDVYIGGVKQHISYIRFKVVGHDHSVIQNSIIFP